MNSAVSLRGRLTLQSALVALVPLVVVAVIALFWWLPLIRADIEVQQQERALAVSNQVMAHLGEAERELQSLAAYLSMAVDDPIPQPVGLLDIHAGETGLFNAIYLTDQTDSILTVGLPPSYAARRSDFVGTDLSRRAFMAARHQLNTPVWSDTFLSTVSGRMAVAYVIPIGSGTLVGELSIERLARFLSNLPAESRLVTMLLDGRDQVVAQSHGSFSGHHIDMYNAPMFGGTRPESADSRGFRLEGRNYIGSLVDVRRFGWKVLVAQLTEDALRPWRLAVWTLGGVLLLALVLSGGAGWLMARRISREFSAFTGQARLMAEGRYDAPWPTSRVREFAALSRDLQKMAQAIRRREDDLAASEARYRSVVSNAPVALMRLDSRGVITLYEGRSLSKLGLDPGQVLGRPVMEVFQDSPKIVENARQALSGQASQFTARVGRNEFEVYFSPVWEDEATPYVLGVMVDVTQRQRAERALEASERLLRESQKVARLGHYSAEISSGRWENSPVLDDILGISAGYLKDRDRFLTLVHPADRKEVAGDLIRSASDPTERLDREFRIIRISDQQERWVHALGRIDRDEHGEPERMIGTIQDITDSKALEQQLLQSQKMEAVGQLAGGVAHDFNNMLSVILGYTEIMNLNLSPDSPLLSHLKQIELAAERSRDITRQLLAFSRKQIISPRRQDLNQLVEGSAKALARLIGEDVSLKFKPAEDLWPVKVDSSQMDQILMNLAVNARDAMPDGGTLLIESQNVVIDQDYCRRHAYCRPGNFVMLAVSDVGVGMDHQTLSHIFEPFFTTKPVGRGTGLGLATVYGIVKQNDGFINVYSEPGKGTTFRIYLPRAVGEDEPEEEKPATGIHAGTGQVLLVEDDEMVRRTTATMLEELGYTVTSPASPAEALEVCLGGGPAFDLLVTDVVMPQMSGKELRDRILALQPGIAVLFISGYTSDIIVHKGVLEPGVHFLAKPFDLSDLAAKVRQAMSSESGEGQSNHAQGDWGAH